MNEDNNENSRDSKTIAANLLASEAKIANNEMTNSIPFDNELAQDVFCKNIKENDLKIVEGINPKIEGLFHVFGIKTWKDLGESSVERCQKILKSVGDRYQIKKPKTWPKQATLAYQGKWKELQQWQGELEMED